MPKPNFFDVMGASSLQLLTLALVGYGLGAMLPLGFTRQPRLAIVAGFGLGSGAALLGAASAISFLREGGAAPVTGQLLPLLIPYLKFGLRLDPLGAFFVLVLSVLGLALSIYSLGYARGFIGRHSPAVLASLFNALLLATTLVFVADNAFFFLLAWELMALTAWALVSFEHEKPETRGAGALFFVMSHIGTGCLIAGFLLLYAASGQTYEFSAFQKLGPRLSGNVQTAAFLLFLAGFGVKAGIIPLHIWLPEAHPVAPSNVSALMSGVLIKTGIYGLARVTFDFLGAPPLWWGVTMLALGIVSAVLGVLYALMEHDLKRLLAYHSIENIGIILMGLGASLIFLHTGHSLLAALALAAGMFHTINHALFKGLLFLGAGAVLQATGTRDMEKLGGLIKNMPKTALFFLAGAIAISALPPLNGFVSEWLTYQSLLQGFGVTQELVRLIFPLGGAMLALTGALAAACFVKAFAITFLAQPRSPAVARAQEASPTMLVGMGLLTAACIFLGLFPGTFLSLLDPVTRQMTGQAIRPELAFAGGYVLRAGQSGGAISPAVMVLLGLCLAPIPLVLWWLFGRGAINRIGPSWDCGLKGLTPKMEYSATGFSKPLRMIFKALFRPRREVQREYDYSPYFAKTLRFESHIEEAFERRLYRPLNWLVLVVSRRVRSMQAGSLHAYLFYIFALLLGLLMFAL